MSVSSTEWSSTIRSSELEQIGVGLRNYADVLRRRKWVVIAAFAFAVLAAVLLSLAQRPVHRSESKILIGQEGTTILPQYSNVTQTYTATMADLLRSNDLAARVIRQLNLDDTPEHLLSKVDVSINPETSVIKLTVDMHKPEEARRINAAFGNIFSRLVAARLGQANPQEGTPRLTATVWDPAHVLPRKVAPRPVRNVVIAGVLGLVLGLLAAFMRDHFDRGLRTREMVEGAFGVPVIAQIPFAKFRKKDRRIVFWQGVGEVAEAFRGLRANLQYLAVKRPLRTILFTSASPQQGKTTVAANLALAIARSGATTIVLEADLRRPRLDDAFETSPHPLGLTSVLVGNADLEDAVVDMTLPTGQLPGGARAERDGRLSYLPAGPQPPNPSELLSSLQMRKLLDQLALSYDYVLIDSPPVLLVADALELARHVDGVVLVVRRNNATTDDARELRALVERLDVNLVGVVFTDVTPAGSYGTYGGYRDVPPRGAREKLEPELESVAREEF
jgi:capsular exopolysaccharide synthesis family protein